MRFFARPVRHRQKPDFEKSHITQVLDLQQRRLRRRHSPAQPKAVRYKLICDVSRACHVTGRSYFSKKRIYHRFCGFTRQRRLRCGQASLMFYEKSVMFSIRDPTVNLLPKSSQNIASWRRPVTATCVTNNHC